MNALVDRQCTSDSKGFPTSGKIADIRLLLCVTAHVLLECCRLGEVLVAYLALKRAVAGV